MEFLCRFLIEWNTATSQQQVLKISVGDEISVKIILKLSLRENVLIKKKIIIPCCFLEESKHLQMQK